MSTAAAGNAVVILGGVPYETTANQTSLHMFDALGRKGVPTLYVSRTVQHRSLRRALMRPLHPIARGLVQVDNSKWVLTLPWMSDALPMSHPPLVRRWQVRQIRCQVEAAMRVLQLKQPRLLTYWWMFPEIVAAPIWQDRTFDLIDRHWGYEHLGRARKSNERSLVIATAKAANKTVAVSAALAEELTNGTDLLVGVVHNGVDLGRVRRATSSSELPRRTRSALYCGGWNSRIDEELLHACVSNNPDWTFDFIGGGIPAWLKRFANVRDWGQLNYDHALAHMAAAQVGLIPFRKTQYTDASNFLKLLDYLATGMSVLGTGLPALEEAAKACPDRVLNDPEPEAWNSLDTLRFGSASAPAVQEYLDERSTDRRVEQLMGQG